MWIQVRTMDGKVAHTVDSLSRLTKVEELRKKIQELFHVEPGLQRLFYRGKQMEDGHTLFDYDVRLNDTIQLLVRQSLVLPVPVPSSSGGSKERDSELSDTDSGCGLAQSESDKSSNSGEAANEPEGKADEDECDETELGLYKVGEYVDARDTNMGAWFEAKVIRVTRKAPAHDQSSSSSSKPEDDIIYHVTYDDYPENGVVQMTSQNVRARARHTIKWEDLQVGQVVMVNYNPDLPKDRGFWYDAEILRKRETRTARELHANVRIGGDSLNDCRIVFVDEVFKIERPGEGNPMVENPMRRKSGPSCKHCKDDERKLCRMCACHVCGGKQDPDKQLMCDECDMAFHIYCLRPPLSSVPPEEEWYCPDCRIDSSEVVQAGEKLKESKKKAKMASATSSSQRDWGKGMACVGRTKECTIVPSNHFGPIPGIPVGTMWRFRVQVSESGSIDLTWRVSTAGAITGPTPWSWLEGMRTMWTMGTRSRTQVVADETFPETSGLRNSLVIRNSPTPTGLWLSTALPPSTTSKGPRPRTGGREASPRGAERQGPQAQQVCAHRGQPVRRHL